VRGVLLAQPLLQGTGDEEDVESSSATLVETEDGYQPVFFDPRPLKNLLLVDEMPSLMPVADMKVANLLNEEIPQVGTSGRVMQ
jgi:splicing factor 3B subunit 3